MAQYIYGKNAVLSRVEAGGDIEEIFVLETLHDTRILDKLKDYKVTMANKSKLGRLAGNPNHQGIVARIHTYDYASLDEVVNIAEKMEYPLIIMLDGIEDPHNLGAILRSCESIGVNSVIVPKHGSAPLTSTVAKVSTGAIEYVKVASVTNLTVTINKLKDLGYWVVGAEASGDTDFRKVDYKTKIVLVVGSEGKGISPLVYKQCDFKISLPMKGKINSLNASNAAAILLYAIHSLRFPLQ